MASYTMKKGTSLMQSICTCPKYVLRGNVKNVYVPRSTAFPLKLQNKVQHFFFQPNLRLFSNTFFHRKQPLPIP